MDFANLDSKSNDLIKKYPSGDPSVSKSAGSTKVDPPKAPVRLKKYRREDRNGQILNNY